VARELPHLTTEQRAHAVNALLSGTKIQLVGEDLDNPRYRAMGREESIKMKGLGVEDILLYQVIGQAGNTGIWTRDMKQRTNLAQNKINKSLKLLEERRLVKAVRSVHNASRKVYMLSNLEPAKEITGGPWYGSDQQPDREFIAAIRHCALEYASQHPHGATAEQVASFIASTNVSHQVLSPEDIDGVLCTLKYDGLLDNVENVPSDARLPTSTSSGPGQRSRRYKLAKHRIDSIQPYSEIPCGVCPVFHKCQEGGPISPERCTYYTQWLNDF
jgi:DNA-directed RNA polymerase III subunit RPC6